MRKRSSFCKMVKGELQPATVYEDNEILAIMDLYPATPGHILVLPKQHIENIYTLPYNLGAHIMEVAIKYIPSSEKSIIPGRLKPDSSQ